MKRRISYFILFKVCVIILFLTVSCSQERSFSIPQKQNLMISPDGVFTDQEWQKSRIIEVGNCSVLLIQDDSFLYIGINANANSGRYVDLFIENDSIGLVNLHASMQLGERQLEKNWNDTIPDWKWGNQRLWTANTVELINDRDDIPFIESVAPYQGFEFRIAKGKLKSKISKMRIEFKDFIGKEEAIIFPSQSERYSTEGWFSIEVN